MVHDEFRDKVIMITGAAGGIGQALCERFDRLGARVHSTDLRKVDRPLFVPGDVGNAEFLADWVSDVVASEGLIDVLVNNAGICPRTPLMETTVDDWKEVLDVNLTSVFALSQLVMGHMVSRRSGAIVNVASMAAKVGGIAVGPHYSASKAAIICLTKTFARFGAPYGVRVNAVAPGVIDTPITHTASPEQLLSYRSTIPMGRVGDPSEVAGPIVFLASTDASYITGATLDINGGFLMD